MLEYEDYKINMLEKKTYRGIVCYDRTTYGFIQCDELRDNTFYHYSACVPCEQIHKGDVVEFELAPGRDGKIQASKVRIIRGEESNV
jgi:cold shock CspA family protein